MNPSRFHLDPMDHKDKMRIRSAAFRITRVYPGVVGEVLSRELLMWEEFGYRLGSSSVIMKLVEHALTTPTPGESNGIPHPTGYPTTNVSR